MKKYFINVSTIKDKEKVIPVYGLTFKNCSIKKEIFNISTNEKEVEKIIALCNEENLHPIHLDDVIENYLITVHTQYCN